MGQANEEQTMPYQDLPTGVTARERDQVPHILDAIQEQIAKLEVGLTIILTPELQEETKANPAPTRSPMVVQLADIHTRLAKLNKRLDL